MIDLFGNEHPEPGDDRPALALDLFDHAAERAAATSGRPVSQERTEVVAPSLAREAHAQRFGPLDEASRSTRSRRGATL